MTVSKIRPLECASGQMFRIVGQEMGDVASATSSMSWPTIRNIWPEAHSNGRIFETVMCLKRTSSQNSKHSTKCWSDKPIVRYTFYFLKQNSKHSLQSAFRLLKIRNSSVAETSLFRNFETFAPKCILLAKNSKLSSRERVNMWESRNTRNKYPQTTHKYDTFVQVMVFMRTTPSDNKSKVKTRIAYSTVTKTPVHSNHAFDPGGK